MHRLLNRRVAAVLLLLEFAYRLLLLVAFTFAYSRLEAELDHNAVSVADRVLADLIDVAALVGVLGGALLLWPDKVRARTPRFLRVIWLAVLGLSQAVVAFWWVVMVTRESWGPDSVIGIIGATFCAYVAATCVADIASTRPQRLRRVRGVVEG
ncbi:hypothetical protein [Streptomyces sp. NPDC004286]|uniref:hypothetical protein n=1 Tax=Streptomyces sp. NPDC004286 TaxID=3364696 RepID=UPI0036830F2D